MKTHVTLSRVAMFAVFASLAAGSLAGCASGVAGKADSLEAAAPLDADRAARVRTLMNELALQEGVATHRVLLSIGGRQFDLNSRLAMSRAQGLRLVAMVSAGQVAMDVWVKPGGEAMLMRKPLGMRPAWVKSFAARDIWTLYRSMGEGEYRIVLLDSGESVAVREETQGVQLRHRFDADGGRWLGSEFVKGRRRLWAAENRTPPAAAEGKSNSPSALLVTAPRYRLEIQTTKSDPGPPNPKLFEAPDREKSP